MAALNQRKNESIEKARREKRRKQAGIVSQQKASKWQA